jgi:hypothetical protein
LQGLERLQELYVFGGHPLAPGEVNLPALLADAGFYGGLYAGLISYQRTDARGISYFLMEGREVLRLDRDLARGAMPWRLLTPQEWELEFRDAVAEYARANRRQR